MMMLKVTTLLTVVVLLLTGRSHGQGVSLTDLINQNFGATSNQTNTAELSGDLNDIINDTFLTKPNKTTTPDFKTTTTAPGVYKSCGLEKECVPRHLCLDGRVNTDGIGLLNIRIDGSECAYNELCCALSDKTTKPVVPPVPPVQHDGCGWRNKDGIAYRIQGARDNEAEFGEFPWMVAILRAMDYVGDIIYQYACGGSLIAKNVILTAAHCVINREANELIVRAGEWDTKTTNEILPHVDRRVREIIRHERFHKGAVYNDVALLILSEDFQWQENIRPICLPESSMKFDHSRCYATGWGKDKFSNAGEYQTILKKVDVPIVPHDTCEANLRQTRLGLHFSLHESFICAGGEKGKDTCKGDGGSPLVCPMPGTPDRFYQAGIVSWGIGCAEENIPGVYANVPHLRSWISEKLSIQDIPFNDFTP
ncbi:phenoloxidase-activating factor 2 [Musca domestica]|uniref:Phenoloxidase-activating factor 2 n=2 Tax=Musca domestica TaxID=7370 RepID=A0A1I8N7C2_MUSDO|nr:phenoloxidase-activating factor 2 [Musca domestica]